MLGWVHDQQRAGGLALDSMEFLNMTYGLCMIGLEKKAAYKCCHHCPVQMLSADLCWSDYGYMLHPRDYQERNHMKMAEQSMASAA